MFRLTYLISLAVQNYGFINRICIAVSKSTPKSCSTAKQRGSQVGNWERFMLRDWLKNHCVKSGKKQTTNVILVCQYRTKVWNHFWNEILKKIRKFPKSRRHFGEGLKHFEIFWRVCSTHFTLYETTNKVFVRSDRPFGTENYGWGNLKWKLDHLVWILDICDGENYFKAGNWGYLRLISD